MLLRINSSPLSAPFSVYSFIGFWKWKVRRYRRENMGSFHWSAVFEMQTLLFSFKYYCIIKHSWKDSCLSLTYKIHKQTAMIPSSKTEESKLVWTKILVSSLLRFSLNLNQVIKSFISGFYQAMAQIEFLETLAVACSFTLPFLCSRVVSSCPDGTCGVIKAVDLSFILAEKSSVS